MIDNPDFKDDPEFYVFPSLKYVGIELCQVIKDDPAESDAEDAAAADDVDDSEGDDNESDAKSDSKEEDKHDEL
ncbi:hypothetical protein KSS87_016692 [Heliosperma pusillum]|nr:hypothetical protein KSS87_016692 [Heliosperma pusillum]